MKEVHVVLTGQVGDEKSFLDSAYLSITEAQKRADKLNKVWENSLTYAWVYSIELY